MTRLYALAAAAFTWLLTVPAAAQSLNEVSEAWIVTQALATAPALRAADAEAAGASALADLRERARLPELNVSARYTRLSSLPERLRTLSLDPSGQTAPIVLPQLLNNWNLRASIAINVTDPWLRLAAAARAAGEIASARNLEATSARAGLVYATRAAYYDWARAAAHLQLARNHCALADAQADLERRRVNIGVAPRTRQFALELAQHAAHARVADAQAELELAAAEVQSAIAPRALGNATPQALEIRADAQVEQLPATTITQAPPATAALVHLAEAATATRKEETYALLPRISLLGNLDVSAPSSRAIGTSSMQPVLTWDVGVAIEIPLTALAGQLASRQAATANESAARARVAEARRDLQLAMAKLQIQYRAAFARCKAANAATQLAEQLARVRRAELEAGTVTALELTAAESELFATQTEYTDAYIDQRLLHAKWDLLMGKIAPNTEN